MAQHPALTQRSIQALPTPAVRREVRDGGMPGLILTLQPSGVRSWCVRYRNAAGQGRKHTIGVYPAIDLPAARKLAQAAFFVGAQGGDPAAAKKAARGAGQVPNDRDRVEHVVPAFIERYAKVHTKSWREAERILVREVAGRWHGRHLGTLSKADVYELLDAIVDRGASIQANCTLAHLRKMCGWACERGIITASPCAGVKAPAPKRARDRVLADGELRAVWQACDGLRAPFGTIVRLLILTGARRDEVGGLRWSELDLDVGVWTLPAERSKNGQAHTVPLSAPALALLQAVSRTAGTDLVFPARKATHAANDFGGAKRRLDAALGLDMPAWVFHDLRRTAATGMARLGIGLPVIEKVLNHTSGSFGGIVGVYQRHSFGDEKRRALDAWAAFVERLVTEEPGANVVQLAARAS